MRTMILSILASCVMGSVMAQEDQRSVLVNQQGSAYSVTAPLGWVANKDVASQAGLGAAFHLEGTDWESTNALIFVNTTSLEGTGDNVYDLVSYDIDMYKISSPGIHIQDGGRIAVNRGKGNAIVIQMVNKSSNTYEAVAYIDQGDIVPFFVFSATSQADFEKYMPAFQDMVASYKYFGPVTTVKNTARGGE
ncbi:hypothetical protein BH09BAC1_BH09BAC1_29280 [soil metagenome]